MTNFNRTLPRLSTTLLILLTALLLTACSQPNPLHKTQLLTLGTLVSISIWDKDQELADKAVHRVEHSLNETHRRWHAWQQSDLTQINKKLSDGQSAVSTQDASELLRKAKNLAIRSDHLFNPAIGRLINLWGFHSDERLDGPPPSANKIQALLNAKPLMTDLSFNADEISCSNPAVQLDLGGFAKGYAVDLAIAELRASGIKNAIVNAGGDLRAIGQHGDRAWRIGIRHPQQAGIIASLETQGDESVFTSGNYERFFSYEGKRYHHIIDPRSGYPADQTLSVTVLHNNAATADAAATALFVAGPQHWQRIARQMGIKHVMLIDNDMKIQITRTLAERVQFKEEQAVTLIDLKSKGL